MGGSPIQRAPWPSPRSLVVRVLVASALALGTAYVITPVVVQPLIPVLRAAITLLDDRFIVEDARISHDEGHETLRFRANLARPIEINGRLVYPIGWNGTRAGGFQVRYTLQGVLAYSTLLFIVLLAWPAQHLKEFALRISLGISLAVVLLLVDVPSTVLAELWHGLDDFFDIRAVSGWLRWSRFLMGGGGYILALVMAGGIIGLAHQLCTARNRWRTVSAREFDAFFREYRGLLKVSPPFDRAARHRRLIDQASSSPGGVVARCDWKRHATVYRVDARLYPPERRRPSPSSA